MTAKRANDTMTAITDLQWMRRALELASQGTALASPNPLVGAVLVRDNQEIGQGFYTFDDKKHAEIKAIEQAGPVARGADLFINLEPCCHTGRTGPCTEAIWAAGVRRVVSAMPDPNPLVSGRGFAQLRKAGVEVEVGLEQESAERLNESFAVHIRMSRPLVTLKAAMTLDGKIAASKGNSEWITSDQARSYVQHQRHEQDAILTGIGTVLADDPLLTDRTGKPRRRPLLRVVMDSQLRIPLAAKLLQEVNNDLLVVCSATAPSNKRKDLEQRGAQILALNDEIRPALKDAIEELGRREIISLLIEGGLAINSEALRSGLADKVFLYYAPKLIGGMQALPLAADLGIQSMKDAIMVRGIRHHQFGEDFAIEGYLRKIYI